MPIFRNIEVFQCELCASYVLKQSVQSITRGERLSFDWTLTARVLLRASGLESERLWGQISEQWSISDMQWSLEPCEAERVYKMFCITYFLTWLWSKGTELIANHINADKTKSEGTGKKYLSQNTWLFSGDLLLAEKKKERNWSEKEQSTPSCCLLIFPLAPVGSKTGYSQTDLHLQ